MKLSTVDLRMFAAIADQGGISAAARILGRQKSTVSRDLALLEERLGLRLVHRTTRHVSLTDAGELLATYARRVVEELESAEAAIDGLSDEPRGALRVSAPPALVRFALSPRLSNFQARYPHIFLSIEPTIRVVDLVAEGVDVAIRIGNLPSSSLVARKLTTARVILAASASYVRAHGAPARPADLTKHSLIDLQAHAEARNWVLFDPGGKPTEVPVTPHIAIADPGIVLDLVHQELGIGPVPDIYATRAIASGALVRILPAHICGERPIYAVFASRRLLAPKVKVFIDFVAACLTA